VNSLFSTIGSKYLVPICVCVVTVILFAGLWPCNFISVNNVVFLPDQNGVHFSRRGIIFAKDILRKRYAQSGPGALSIELAIQADKVQHNAVPVIFAINDGQSCDRFIIGQWKSSLIIRSILTDACLYDRSREIGIEDALLPGTSRFISITSDARGTAVYVDGKLKASRKGLSVLRPDAGLSGQLVIGNSTFGKDSWTGTFSTLAIYDHILVPEQIMQHYKVWRDNGSLSPDIGSLPIVLYLFNERTGPIVKDHSGMGIDLIIPEHFIPLQRRMLTSPWEDFQVSKSYAMDVAINIFGFIPFGFCFAFFLSERDIKKLGVVIIVLALGIGLSLFIEIIQAYLPDRSSQLMDVLTNATGTFIGIYLWRRFVLHLRQMHTSHDRSDLRKKIRC